MATAVQIPREVVEALNQQELQSTAFWKNVFNTVIALVVAILAVSHPGFHLPPQYQGLVTAVVPSAAVLAASISTGFFVHGTHQVQMANLAANLELRHLALDERRQALAERGLVPGATSVPNDSGQPVTPTTP